MHAVDAGGGQVAVSVVCGGETRQPADGIVDTCKDASRVSGLSFARCWFSTGRDGISWFSPQKSGISTLADKKASLILLCGIWHVPP